METLIPLKGKIASIHDHRRWPNCVS